MVSVIAVSMGLPALTLPVVSFPPRPSNHHAHGSELNIALGIGGLLGAADLQLHGLGHVHHIGGFLVQQAERDFQFLIAEIAHGGVVDLTQVPAPVTVSLDGSKSGSVISSPTPSRRFPLL